jgi:hypothetical protein
VLAHRRQNGRHILFFDYLDRLLPRLGEVSYLPYWVARDKTQAGAPFHDVRKNGTVMLGFGVITSPADNAVQEISAGFDVHVGQLQVP